MLDDAHWYNFQRLPRFLLESFRSHCEVYTSHRCFLLYFSVLSHVIATCYARVIIGPSVNPYITNSGAEWPHRRTPKNNGVDFSLVMGCTDYFELAQTVRLMRNYENLDKLQFFNRIKPLFRSYVNVLSQRIVLDRSTSKL